MAIEALVIKLLLFVALRVLREYFNYRFQQGLRSQNIIVINAEFRCDSLPFSNILLFPFAC